MPNLSVFHVAVGLNHLTSTPLHELEGMFKDGRGVTIPPAAVVAHAAILKAKGFEVMPPCKNHDHLGYCKGHPESESA